MGDWFPPNTKEFGGLASPKHKKKRKKSKNKKGWWFPGKVTFDVKKNKRRGSLRGWRPPNTKEFGGTGAPQTSKTLGDKTLPKPKEFERPASPKQHQGSRVLMGTAAVPIVICFPDVVSLLVRNAVKPSSAASKLRSVTPLLFAPLRLYAVTFCVTPLVASQVFRLPSMSLQWALTSGPSLPFSPLEAALLFISL